MWFVQLVLLALVIGALPAAQGSAAALAAVVLGLVALLFLSGPRRRLW